MNTRINLKVLVVDTDFYAQHAIDSYMAWDRRTRIVALVFNPAEAFEVISTLAEAELPDVILLEPDSCVDVAALRQTILAFRKAVPGVIVICLAHQLELPWISAAVNAGARAYLLRNEVGMHLVSAICYTLENPLVVTRSVHNLFLNLEHGLSDNRLLNAKILPKEREYPEMTERIRQALWLCVIEGMSAQLAADEMGVSPHTIRSYIKEGYRILKAHDATEYPQAMSPEEQAFMRFTSLDPEGEEETTPERGPRGDGGI